MKTKSVDFFTRSLTAFKSTELITKFEEFIQGPKQQNNVNSQTNLDVDNNFSIVQNVTQNVLQNLKAPKTIREEDDTCSITSSEAGASEFEDKNFLTHLDNINSNETLELPNNIINDKKMDNNVIYAHTKLCAAMSEPAYRAQPFIVKAEVRMFVF
jgi:hypothetical protein